MLLLLIENITSNHLEINLSASEISCHPCINSNEVCTLVISRSNHELSWFQWFTQECATATCRKYLFCHGKCRRIIHFQPYSILKFRLLFWINNYSSNYFISITCKQIFEVLLLHKTKEKICILHVCKRL